MADLKSMKITKSQQEKATKPSMMEYPQYPYGLSIRLDNDSLKKLGIKELPEVGEKMTVIAKVEVTSASQNKSTGGDSKNVELQITDMCLEDEGDAKEASKELYGE